MTHKVAAAGYVSGTQRRFVVCVCGEWFLDDGKPDFAERPKKHFEDLNKE
jgi:hypothetical protein